jgi:hypothetical protein
MNRRFRIVAALFALVAFSAYYAEGVLAVFCVSDSSHHAEMTISHAAGEAHTATSHESASHEAPAEGSHKPHCPLSMDGGMTCAPVSVPAVAAAVVPTPASTERALTAAEFNIQLLLSHSLYHPPRA